MFLYCLYDREVDDYSEPFRCKNDNVALKQLRSYKKMAAEKDQFFNPDNIILLKSEVEFNEKEFFNIEVKEDK